MRTRILDALFSRLVEKLEGPFRPKDSGEEGGGSRFEDIGERTVRLAGLLPTVARQSHLVLNGLPNEYAEVRFLSFFFSFSGEKGLGTDVFW